MNAHTHTHGAPEIKKKRQTFTVHLHHHDGDSPGARKRSSAAYVDFSHHRGIRIAHSLQGYLLSEPMHQARTIARVRTKKPMILEAAQADRGPSSLPCGF